MLDKVAEKALLHWRPINERLLLARFDSKYSKLSSIQCYTTTNDAEEKEKENSVYNELQAITSTIPKHDILVIMGDVNANVGADKSCREDHMAGNGELFADFCGLNSTMMGGTIFTHKDIHKYTWISPDRKTKNQTDHIAINKKRRTSLLDVRANRGADVGSDHMLVVSTIRQKLRRAVKPSQRRRPNLGKLKDPDIRTEFNIKLQNRFQTLADMEEQLEETGVDIDKL